MGFFRELAGSASSVYTTMMFLLGGTFGWLSGVLNDGTLLPIAAMMLGAVLDGQRDQPGDCRGGSSPRRSDRRGSTHTRWVSVSQRSTGLVASAR